MIGLLKLSLAMMTLLGGAYASARADEALSVDVVHFWISKSEASALDVFRMAWQAQGNRWIDLPAANKIAVQQAVSDRVANGYPPAVMQWNANEGSRELPEMGIVSDLEDVARAQRWREVLPRTVVDRISYNGKIYFAPTNVHAENWLWTSKALFADLGIQMPRNWDELFSAAERMKQAGVVPIALGGGKWEISLIFNNIMFQMLGADGYARIIRGDAEAVLEPGFKTSLEMLRRLSRYAAPVETRVGMNWADATENVGRGRAGMQFMGDWAKGELTARGYVIDRDFDCSLVPGTEIAYFMVIDAFAFPITDHTGSADTQQKFAGMLLERDHQLAFSKIKGSIPVRTDVDWKGLDRCGRLGHQMLLAQRDVSAQSMAMAAQVSEGWIAILADFFNDENNSVEQTRQHLYQILRQG